jgi:carbon-monoxide dehydrogenase medium subunit
VKAPAFDYVKPRSLDEVFKLQAEYGDEARLLAGGQTLLATLNMRLSEPSLLIDINAIAALKGIALHDSADGQVLRIGALATHSEIEASALIARHAPLLALAAPHIAHRAIRNLGTWGGSIAYGDPAAEWPTCLMALDGVVLLRSAGAERRVAARDFFLDLYSTALREGEIITGCELPVRRSAEVLAFDELARRHGDYAIVGLAVSAEQVLTHQPHQPHQPQEGPEPRSGSGLQRLRLAFLGIGTTPVRALRTEALFETQPLTAAGLDGLIASLQAELDPLADLTHSAATKRHLACVLARRLLTGLLSDLPTGLSTDSPAA